MNPRSGTAKRPRFGKTVLMLRLRDAEPFRERGGKLIDGGRRNPAAGAGVVGAADGERGPGAEGALSVDGAAHDEVVAAPAVIAAERVAREGAAEIAVRETGDAFLEIGVAILHADLVHGGLEGVHGLAELGEEIGLRAEDDLGGRGILAPALLVCPVWVS